MFFPPFFFTYDAEFFDFLNIDYRNRDAFLSEECEEHEIVQRMLRGSELSHARIQTVEKRWLKRENEDSVFGAVFCEDDYVRNDRDVCFREIKSSRMQY